MNDKEYKKWQIQVEKTKMHNNKFLIEFRKHLDSKSLKKNTIKAHADNI
jgi:hypothetical protein